MIELNNLILLLVVLLNFYTLGTSRLVACIRAVAIQGGLLALLPLVAHGFSLHTLILSFWALMIKAILIPNLLTHTIREVRIRREIEPLVGFVPTLALGALVTSGAFIFANYLPLITEHRGSLFIPTALATFFSGFLLLMTRRKAITQVVGYLILENGIFIFGILLSEAMPLMVEAGVLLDMMVGIFVMGIVINQINREFSTMNTERLSALKE